MMWDGKRQALLESIGVQREVRHGGFRLRLRALDLEGAVGSGVA